MATITDPTPKPTSPQSAAAFRAKFDTMVFQTTGSIKPRPKTTPNNVAQSVYNIKTYNTVTLKTGYENLVLPVYYDPADYETLVGWKESGKVATFETSDGFTHAAMIVDVDPQEGATDGGAFEAMNITFAFVDAPVTPA